MSSRVIFWRIRSIRILMSLCLSLILATVLGTSVLAAQVARQTPARRCSRGDNDARLRAHVAKCPSVCSPAWLLLWS